MGKIHDALQRAEAERAPQGTPVPVAPSRLERPTGAHSAPRADQKGRLARWAQRIRSLAATPDAVEDAGAVNKRRITMLHPDSYVAEQFRSLRARLDSLATERPIGTMALTSAMEGEGKTTAAVNLAVVSSMAVGRRVLLVDCDMRRPKVHTVLGLRPEFGLAEVLNDQTSIDHAITKVEGTNLDVLPVRSSPSNPSELLSSPRMRMLVEELRQRYDLVLFDTPPVLSVPDAKIVSEIVDGVLLVVRADETPADEVDGALDVLDRRRVLGLVLNGAQVDEHKYGY
jgi:capsular exopolysaccharide synthesis family protein